MAAVKKLAEMLLNPDVTLGPFDSFPEFQELFPPKYRYVLKWVLCCHHSDLC